MIGALAGDIIGSMYEWHNIKTTEFPLFGTRCRITDDSVLTIALADAILSGSDYVPLLKKYYARYPDAGFGGHFAAWAQSDDTSPYNSWGNGAAMRISPVGFAYPTLAETLKKSHEFTAVTHNHPEGIKGGQSTAAAIFLARTGSSKTEIRDFITSTFGYDLSRSLDQIRPGYKFDVSSQGTVPEAMIAFLESNDFEDALRKAVSLGGDCDTLTCITGGIAQAFYGIPAEIEERVYTYLDEPLSDVTRRFTEKHVKKSS